MQEPAKSQSQAPPRKILKFGGTKHGTEGRGLPDLGFVVLEGLGVGARQAGKVSSAAPPQRSGSVVVRRLPALRV